MKTSPSTSIGGLRISRNEASTGAGGGTVTSPLPTTNYIAGSDKTAKRAAEKEKDELVADKVLLIKELQHRVANSLQIIASVLMQSARRVSSDEIRSHLQKAHNRVLSVASLQKQLATTGALEVELRPYFTQLCSSIGASMIADPEELSIAVDVDETVVRSDVSVSLGLIVTELVINCLKHAFPDGRGGVIKVSYRTDEDGWTLNVADDGVGMPANPRLADAGLGTSIVEALARQLRARIMIADAKPGTSISIVHEAAETSGADVLPLVRAI
ncbi:sensor histidine kinase [Sphingomonas sp.]|uniref:sensor histidine kinase n=1 Tax=Sphingomonas sp. TaxID=28214 RepID=UPI00286CC570|nr:sensor histidine kinase [Sphingomonas sp.]